MLSHISQLICHFDRGKCFSWKNKNSVNNSVFQDVLTKNAISNYIESRNRPANSALVKSASQTLSIIHKFLFFDVSFHPHYIKTKTIQLLVFKNCCVPTFQWKKVLVKKQFCFGCERHVANVTDVTVIVMFFDVTQQFARDDLLLAIATRPKLRIAGTEMFRLKLKRINKGSFWFWNTTEIGSCYYVRSRRKTNI